MAILVPRSLRTARAPLLVLVLTAVLPLGCVAMDKWGDFLHKEKHQVHPTRFNVFWANDVGWAPDANQQGRPVPGFAGRMWLFGPLGYTLPVDGTLTVSLHDPHQRAANGDFKPIYNWHLTAPLLKSLESEQLGLRGASLFFPWSTYDPNVKEVILRAKYVPSNGVPLFHDSGVMRLGGLKVIKPPTTRKSDQPPAPVLPPPTRSGASKLSIAAPGSLSNSLPQ